MDEGFRTFEHTGDLGLEVWAPSPERLHARAAIALAAQEVEAEGDPFEVEVVLTLEGSDPADLLVHWLNTSLLEAQLRRAVWIEAEVELPGGNRLRGRLRGPRRDRARHVHLREIKAVSHHG